MEPLPGNRSTLMGKSMIALGRLKSMKFRQLSMTSESLATSSKITASPEAQSSIFKKPAAKLTKPLNNSLKKGRTENVKLPQIGKSNAENRKLTLTSKPLLTQSKTLPEIVKTAKNTSSGAFRWRRAERRLVAATLPPLPKMKSVAQEETVSLTETEKIERDERRQFNRFLDNLPHIEADLTKKQVDQYFWLFFRNLEKTCSQKGSVLPNLHENDANSSADIEEDFVNKNVDNFLQFCRLHATYEKKRQIFYAMCARQMVKQRQLELLKMDKNSYEERALFVSRLFNTSQTKSSQKSIETCFDSLMERFTKKSYELCSLKCREYFLNEKLSSRLKLKRNDENEVAEKLKYLKWEINRQQKFNIILDEEMSKISYC